MRSYACCTSIIIFITLIALMYVVIISSYIMVCLFMHKNSQVYIILYKLCITVLSKTEAFLSFIVKLYRIVQC